MTWSSRVIIDGTVSVLSRYDAVAKISIFAVLLAMPFIMAKSLGENVNPYYAYGFCFCYGILPMGSAGWLTTIVTYYYVLFFILLQIFLFRYRDRNSVFFILVISFIYSANHEQGALISLFFLCISIYNGCRDVRTFFCFFIVLTSFLYIMLSPGNAARFQYEMQMHFPEYVSFSLLYKLYIGIATTLYRYFLVPNQITLLLFFCIFLVEKKPLRVAIAKICIILSILSLHQIFLGNHNIKSIKDSFLYWQFFSTPTVYACIYFFVVIAILTYVVYKILSVCKTYRECMLILLFIAVGFISRFIIGFSPVIIGFVERTFLFCDFAIIASALLLFSKTDIQQKNYIIWAGMATQLLVTFGRFV